MRRAIAAEKAKAGEVSILDMLERSQGGGDVVPILLYSFSGRLFNEVIEGFGAEDRSITNVSVPEVLVKPRTQGLSTLELAAAAKDGPPRFPRELSTTPEYFVQHD